jgi:hypothetical protein
VLYHRFQLPGSASEDTVHAPIGQNYRLNLGVVSPPSSCRPLLAEAEAAAAVPASAPSQEGASAAAPAPRTPVVTLSGVTEFNVTEGGERALTLHSCGEPLRWRFVPLLCDAFAMLQMHV